MKKSLIPCLYLKDGQLMEGFEKKGMISASPVKYAVSMQLKGADMLIIFDLSDSDAEHEKNLSVIREIMENTDIDVIGAGNIKRSEDVKKLKYAGCRYVALNMAKQSNIDLIEEVSKRFGKDSIMACVDVEEEILNNASLIREYVSGVVLLNNNIADSYRDLRIFCVTEGTDEEGAFNILSNQCVAGISGSYVNQNTETLRSIKKSFKEKGLEMWLPEAAIGFDELKKGSDGLIPVVTTDAKTDKVLMVAYMNKEAYEKTIETGIMTYYSRSRQCLWLKGETSGHYQFLRELTADCDLDTLTAKVKQIGAACHTGSYSCFFNNIIKLKENDNYSPMQVFDQVFSVILDRKENPKEGSYTNYLFEKGIDKILKKVGEEATEIVIAAKNPDREEVKYEIADFLYHMMVLMAECGLDWNDITGELANR